MVVACTTVVACCKGERREEQWIFPAPRHLNWSVAINSSSFITNAGFIRASPSLRGCPSKVSVFCQDSSINFWKKPETFWLIVILVLKKNLQGKPPICWTFKKIGTRKDMIWACWNQVKEMSALVSSTITVERRRRNISAAILQVLGKDLFSYYHLIRPWMNIHQTSWTHKYIGRWLFIQKSTSGMQRMKYKTMRILSISLRFLPEGSYKRKEHLGGKNIPLIS